MNGVPGFDKFPDSLKPLYIAIGKVAYAWAYVENILDSCVVTIFHIYDGKTLAEKQEFPRSLTKKIPFLRKCLRKVPKLNQYQIEGRSLLNRTRLLSKIRNDMIHSIFHNANQDSFLFSKYDYKENLLKIREFNFTLDDYHQAGNKMMDLAYDLSQYCLRLIPQNRKV